MGVCLVIPFILDVRVVDASAGVTKKDGHTEFLHLPSVALASMVLIVTNEIPGPILHCGRCHTLDTRALDDLMYSSARCCPVFLGNS